MKVNQVFEFINDVIAQTTGLNNVSVVDAKGLVALGNEVLSSDTNVENFMGVMYDKTARMIVNNRAYEGRGKSLMMDAFVFGAILQKIYVDPMEAKESPQWSVEDNTEYSPIYVVKPVVKQKIFSGITTWEFDTAIPDVQIRSAFTDAEQMAVFIDAIYVSLANSMNMALEGMANTVYSTMIANRLIEKKVKNNTANVVVDLLAEYKAYTGDDAMTAEQANTSPEFYKFAGMIMKQTIMRMRQMGVTFNTEKYYRHTPTDMLRVSMVSDFVAGFDTYLQADTFHNEVTALPNYDEVPFWQGSGQAWNETRKVAIDIKHTDDVNYRVQQDGVVAIFADIEAMGMTINNQRQKSVYDPRHEVTAVYNKADKGYFCDPSENAVVFVLADEVATPQNL